MSNKDILKLIIFLIKKQEQQQQQTNLLTKPFADATIFRLQHMQIGESHSIDLASRGSVEFHLFGLVLASRKWFSLKDRQTRLLQNSQHAGLKGILSCALYHTKLYDTTQSGYPAHPRLHSRPLTILIGDDAKSYMSDFRSFLLVANKTMERQSMLVLAGK